MSFETRYPSAANLIGNVAVPRNVLPMIRSSVRRNNPDLVSSAPYYPSASGKTLRVNYTKEVSTVVTPATVDITLSGNSLVSIIADINAADSSNLKALDLDGFLTIQNLNPGKTHLLTIAPFTTTPSNDAAPVLGFVVDPLPGSTSYAGEIAAAPGSRSQSNPQTTALLAKDDSLGTDELNRGLVAILQLVENLRAELARDVVTYKDIPLTFSTHAGDGSLAARINDDNIRIFYPEITDPATTDLTTYYRVLNTSNEEEIHGTFNTTEADALTTSVRNLYYATTGTPFLSSGVFATWGTPDGGSIISSTTVNKDKHASTAVTSIKGNIVHCSSATFVTKKVKAGDPVQFTASTLQPFDHSGWFAVDAVIDETHLAIRPMAKAEQTPVLSGIKPRYLNPSAAGTLRVAMGRFIPAGDVFVRLTGSVLIPGNYVVRVAVGVPFTDTLTDERVNRFSGSLNKLAQVLSSHIHSSTAHRARNILFEAISSGSIAISDGHVQGALEALILLLTSTTTSSGGSRRIGAEAISIGGASPNSLSSGSVFSQLTDLLTLIRDHNAAATSYAGGPAWADGTTNPATTVEAQLDKIITDLATGAGTAKLLGAAVGSDLAGGTLAAQIADLATNWFKLSRPNTITAAQIFNALVTIDTLITKNSLTVGGQPLTFTSFTFTANSVTDQFTCTAHGLITGDGPINLSNVGGSLPSPLLAATDYYIIRDDANTFKLADTRQKAFLGTFRGITSNGTGTHTLSATGGTTRPADTSVTRDLAVDGSFTLGANDYYPLRTITINPQVGGRAASGTPTFIVGGVQGVDLDWTVSFGGRVGDRIVFVTFAVDGNIGVTYGATLVSVTVGGGTSTIGTGFNSGSGNSIDIVPISPVNHVIVANETFELRLSKGSPGGATSHYYTITVGFDRIP